jgi:hypothetical protein
MRKSVIVAVIVTWIVISYMPSLALPNLMGKRGK